MDEKIEIIFEDADILVLSKPAGLVTTREGRREENTVEEWMEKNRPNTLARSGIVHRLDKGTSGILLTAKNQEALDSLKGQFKNRQTIKHYKALLCGDVSFQGEINIPIDRSKYVFGKFGPGVDGKQAWTKFSLIKKYQFNGKKYSLVDVDLKTGRTHQIRVHFSYLGWSLLGDRLYGGELNFGLSRPFLHAYSMEFFHPKTKEKIKFENELAADLKLVLDQL